MKKLYLFGSPELHDENESIDQSLLTGPKRLSLLAYLVLKKSGEFIRRDTLLPLFWPTSNQKNARNALSNILYHLRQSLGDDMVINRGNEEIKLGKLWCDVQQFEKAVQAQSYKLAANLYKGPLLEGFHLSDVSSEFQEWLEFERQQLSQKYCKVLKNCAREAEQRGEIQEAFEFWQRCSKEAPLDSSVIKKLMISMGALGHKAEAINIGKDFAKKLEEQLGANADEEFQKLTQEFDESVSEINERKEDTIETDHRLELELNRFGLIGKNKDYLEGAFDDFRHAFKQYVKNSLPESQEHYRQALEKIHKARINQPQIAILHFAEGIALYHLKRYTEAIFAFEEALALTNHEESFKAKICSAMAVTYAAVDNIPKAEEWLSQIKTTNEHFAIALVYASLGKQREAGDLVKQIGKVDTLTEFSLHYLFPEILEPIRKNNTLKRK